jgi:hypothetical protein
MNTNERKRLSLRNACARLEQVKQPMKNSTTGQPANSSGRRSYNIRMDRALIACLKDYCSKNKRAGKECDVIEDQVFRYLRSRARKYRLNIPAHLLQ